MWENIHAKFCATKKLFEKHDFFQFKWITTLTSTATWTSTVCNRQTFFFFLQNKTIKIIVQGALKIACVELLKHIIMLILTLPICLGRALATSYFNGARLIVSDYYVVGCRTRSVSSGPEELIFLHWKDIPQEYYQLLCKSLAQPGRN